jgi:hypothetical protein
MEIVKTLGECLVKVSNNLRNNPENALEQAKQAALWEILKYVYDLSYISNEKVKGKVIDYIKITTEYKKVNGYKFVAELHSVTDKAVRQDVDKANEEALKRIGKDTIDLIMQGKVEEGLAAFKEGIRIKYPHEVLLKGVNSLLGEVKDNGEIKSIDCLDVLCYLKSITKKSIKSTVINLGTDRVSFVKYILENNDAKYAELKQLFFEYLDNKTSLDNVVTRLGEIKIL